MNYFKNNVLDPKSELKQGVLQKSSWNSYRYLRWFFMVVFFSSFNKIFSLLSLSLTNNPMSWNIGTFSYLSYSITVFKSEKQS